MRTRRQTLLIEGLATNIGSRITGFAKKVGSSDRVQRGIAKAGNKAMSMAGSGYLPLLGMAGVPNVEAPFELSKRAVSMSRIKPGKAGAVSGAVRNIGALAGANAVINKVGADDQKKRFGRMMGGM